MTAPLTPVVQSAGWIVRCHAVHGDGRVLELEPPQPMRRVHVRFEGYPDHNERVTEDELTRLIGPILTSEDLW